MAPPARWPLMGWWPLLAGLLWLALTARHGGLATLLAGVPALIMVAAGVGTLLWSGDRRIPQFLAFTMVLSLPIALLVMLLLSVRLGLLMLLLAALCWLHAGYLALRQMALHNDVPPPRASVALAAKVALDDALLAWFLVGAELLPSRDAQRVRGELDEAMEQFRAAGYLAAPERYHQTPPPLESPELTRSSIAGHAVQLMRFDSEYAPREGEPGRERWLAYERNRKGYAMVFQHTDRPRPWLLAIHGYQMGRGRMDLQLFPPRYLHQELGMNVIMPVLPLHGPRRHGWLSGNGYIRADAMDTLHAQAQALWDLRRVMSWVRGQAEGQPIGCLGYSLGGYNAALLSAFEDDLSTVIAGIPAPDLAALLWQHGPAEMLAYYEHVGLSQARIAELWQLISPLNFSCRVPVEKRFIFAGVADRVIPPELVLHLWQHWQQPEIAWYQGTHLVFEREPAVRRTLVKGLRAGGLISAAGETLS